MRFRTRRLSRVLLVGAFALAGLLVALDVVALQVFEARAGTGLARSTAAERASVELGGFPFLPSFMRARLEQIEVAALGMSGTGLRVDRFEVRMNDFTFQRRRAVALVRSRYATRMDITGSDVIGRFEINERDLGDYVRARTTAVQELRITPSGVEILFEGAPGDRPPVRYLPRMERDPEQRTEDAPLRLSLMLVGRDDVPEGRMSEAERLVQLVDLPPLPPGFRGSVELGSGAFSVDFAGPQLSMRIGSGPDPRD